MEPSKETVNFGAVALESWKERMRGHGSFLGEPHRMRTDNLELPFLAGVPPWTPRQPAPTVPRFAAATGAGVNYPPAKAGPVTQTF